MKGVIIFLMIGMAAVSAAVAQEIPVELAELAARTRIGDPITTWCPAEFRSGEPGAFAVGVGSGSRGRYLALERNGNVTELAAFGDGADLACYSRAEAESLDRGIRESTTVQGGIQPRFDTTVVCGFLDNTTAECWQYSREAEGFLRVGGWIT